MPTLSAATVPDLLGGSYIGPDGIGEHRGYPVIVQGTKASRNLESAERLWRVSEEMTGVRFPDALKSGEAPAAA